MTESAPYLRPRGGGPRLGMTLVELMVSLALVTIIVAACGSMLMLMGKAVANDKSNVGSDATVARSATDQVIDDLKVATAVTEQAATAVTMSVPDRDGDGQPETIRYAWSGTPGDPLTRAYNSRPIGVVADNVRALNFGFLGKTVGKPPAVEGAEQSVAVHASGVTANLVGYQLTAVKGAAGYVKPDFSAAVTATGGPTTWKPTRCRVQLQRTSTSVGTVTVSVRYADGAGKPTGAALCSGTVLLASVLTSTTWVDVAFTSTADVDCTKGVCVVVSYASVSGTGGYVFADSVSADAAMSFCATADSGATWTPTAGSALQLYLWGKATTQDNDTYDFQPLPPSAP
jgi:prepilin-type N-terminal cleavage/methylation domain-containing protein